MTLTRKTGEPQPHASASTMAAGAPMRLDAAALATLRTLDPDGQAGVFQRILSTYEMALQRGLFALAHASRTQDVGTLGRLAHTLKSSSLSVGALALAESCAALEALAHKQRPGDLVHAVTHLMADGEAALAAVRDMLHE